MASNAASDVVVLNNSLDRATTCRSRLPRPGRRRSQQLTRSQVTSPVSSNNINNRTTSARLKFPQLEMTKRSHCSASSSKIPLPDLTLKTNLNSSAEWLKERPKTSVDLISTKFKKNLPTSSTHQRKIQELIARRNSSEDPTRFPRFPTLPAIGPSQVPAWESETFDLIQSQEPRLAYCDSESKMSNKIENLNSDLNCEEKADSEPIRLEQNESTMELEAAARPLIRSDTYDILPTLNEEDCDNSNDFETEIEDSNKDNNILSIFDTTSTASEQSDDENLEEKSPTD